MLKEKFKNDCEVVLHFILSKATYVFELTAKLSFKLTKGYGKKHCNSYRIGQYPTVLLLRPTDKITLSGPGRRQDEIDTSFNIEEFISHVNEFLPENFEHPEPTQHDEL